MPKRPAATVEPFIAAGTRAFLQQSPGSHRRGLAGADDEMVEQPDIDELERRFEPARDAFVSLRGLRDARRVVVRENHSCRIDGQRLLDDLARIDAGSVYGAAKHLVELKYAMAVVQEQAAEYLVAKMPEPGLQECFGVDRAADGFARRQGSVVITSRQLGYRANDCCPGSANAALGGERFRLGVQQRP